MWGSGVQQGYVTLKVRQVFVAGSGTTPESVTPPRQDFSWGDSWPVLLVSITGISDIGAGGEWFSKTTPLTCGTGFLWSSAWCSGGALPAAATP